MARAYLNHERICSHEAAITRAAIRWLVALLMAPLVFFATNVLVLFCVHVLA
jgi:hypothetical protein